MIETLFAFKAEIFLLCATQLVLLWGIIRNKASFIGDFVAAAVILVTAYIGMNDVRGVWKGSYIKDSIASFSYGAAAFFLFASILLSRRDSELRRDVNNFEKSVLILFFAIGALISVSSLDFVCLFIGNEIMSIASTAMMLSDRKHIPPSESATKFFLFSSVASATYLYGVSLVYSVAGSTLFSDAMMFESGNLPLRFIGCSLILAGLLFKIGAFPFSMWMQDVYRGSPIFSLLTLGAASKIVSLAPFFRMFSCSDELAAYFLTVIFKFTAVLSIMVGTACAFREIRLGRFLSFASIAQTGYSLLALSVGTPGGYAASVLYTIIYSVSASTMMASSMLFLDRAHTLYERKISDFAGLIKTNPVAAVFMCSSLLSAMGMPPFAGFYGKLYVFSVSIKEIGFLIIPIIISGVVSSVYYLKAIRVICTESKSTVPYYSVISGLKFDSLYPAFCIVFFGGFQMFFLFFSDLFILRVVEAYSLGN